MWMFTIVEFMTQSYLFDLIWSNLNTLSSAHGWCFSPSEVWKDIWISTPFQCSGLWHDVTRTQMPHFFQATKGVTIGHQKHVLDLWSRPCSKGLMAVWCQVARDNHGSAIDHFLTWNMMNVCGCQGFIPLLCLPQTNGTTIWYYLQVIINHYSTFLSFWDLDRACDSNSQ